VPAGTCCCGELNGLAFTTRQPPPDQWREEGRCGCGSGGGVGGRVVRAYRDTRTTLMIYDWEFRRQRARQCRF